MAIEAVETGVDTEVYDVTGSTGFVLGQVRQSGSRYFGVHSGGRTANLATVELAAKKLAADRKHESGVPVNVTNQEV